MELLYPQLLWLAGLALPLILLYILKSRRRRQKVSAAWLWEQVHADLEARIPFRRLRREWLLWLQLLVLALLVAAAASPVRRTLLGSGSQGAIVLDASAGMLAGGRFETALGRTRDLIAGLGAADRLAILLAGPEPKVLAPLTEDRGALLAALEDAAALPAPADLEAATELAFTLVGEEGTIVLLTDGSQAVTAGDRLQVVSVGRRGRRNAGIVALGVSPSDASGQDHEAFVRIAATHPLEGSVEAYLDGRLLDAQPVAVAAGEEATATLSLPGAREGWVEVVWSSPAEDDLPHDDRAFWAIAAPRDRLYRLQGPVDSYLRRALAVQPGWRLATAGETADLVVLAGQPSTPNGPPFLWLDPSIGEPGGAGGLLSWDRSHPSLRFAELAGVRFARLPRVPRPAGARVLADSTSGPLIFEGVHGERPYLLWAFRPMDSDLPLRVAFPLLVRNALEHLAPIAGGLPGGIHTGQAPVVPWPQDEKVRLTSPSGRETLLDPIGGSLHLPPITEVGRWRLRGEARALHFAASLLEVGETASRAAEGEGRSAAGVAAAGGNEVWGMRSAWRPLVFLALVLLLVEGAAFHRGWGR